MAKQQEKMYLIRFKPEPAGSTFYGFQGWNTVGAKNKKEAEKLLKRKLGASLYDQIDWSSLLSGARAEKELKRIEDEHRGMFD